MSPMTAVKSRVLRAVSLMGYDLVRNRTSPGERYSLVQPRARFSPWSVDDDFLETYRAVRRSTLVDIYRLYELWQLVAQSASLPRGILLEVGVWKGGSGAMLARSAERAGISDAVYLCDTFRGVVKAGPLDTLYKGGEHADTSAAEVRSLLAKMHLPSVEVLEGIFPDETAARIPASAVRFCHVDVDTYESARDASLWVWLRLEVGGVLVFDDYGFEGVDGVMAWVDEIARQPGRLFIHNLNGHGIVVKTAL
jgi:O-methyltransferase